MEVMKGLAAVSKILLNCSIGGVQETRDTHCDTVVNEYIEVATPKVMALLDKLVVRSGISATWRRPW